MSLKGSSLVVRKMSNYSLDRNPSRLRVLRQLQCKTSINCIFFSANAIAIGYFKDLVQKSGKEKCANLDEQKWHLALCTKRK